MDPEAINVALRVLDDQLLDSEGTRFGRIADIELEGGPGSATRVSALLVGAGAWRWRAPGRLAGIAAAMTPSYVRRIPWELVGEVQTGALTVTVTMKQLGFGTAGPAHVVWVDDIEDRLRVSSLLGARAVRSDGTALGRVHDLRARLEGSAESPGALEVTGLLVGKDGWRQRLMGAGREGRGGQDQESGLMDWSLLERVQDGVIRVSAGA